MIARVSLAARPRNGPWWAIAVTLWPSTLFLPCCFSSGDSVILVKARLISTPELSLPGQFEMEAETVASARVERFSFSDEKAEPIDGAHVTLVLPQVSSGSAAPSVVELVGQLGDRDGFYVADSLETPRLTYTAGGLYVFAASIDGDPMHYDGGVEAPDPPIVTLIPDDPPFSEMLPDLRKHAKGADIGVGWSHGDFSYVTVFRANPLRPDQPDRVFAYPPPRSALEILTSPPSHDVPAVLFPIPGSIFSEDGAYAILLVSQVSGEAGIHAASGAAVILAVGDFSP